MQKLDVYTKGFEVLYDDKSTFNQSNPENYSLLNSYDIEKISNIDFSKLGTDENKILSMRLLNSILHIVRKFNITEAEEIVENWGNFIKSYLFDEKTTVQLWNENSKGLTIHGYPVNVNYSCNMARVDKWYLVDVIITSIETKKIVNSIYDPKILSPLIFSSKPPKIDNILTQFVSWITAPIDYKISLDDTCLTISGLFTIYELLETIKQLGSKISSKNLEEILKAFDRTIKMPNYLNEENELSRLCSLTWPTTAKIVYDFYLKKIRNLNWSNLKRQTYLY